ncbi:GTP 3',8-cyclase MoaA [Conexibacter sp. DBS9H8]|uniref:GTP 3',8-cyclase MoaA n=1 Tax=Conexibacter sp. DBS9H8 TaxID=2937801 RepID=UPI00200CEF04|nr:GTP 3',8-cyclase MoaA [Conexibacter sp. DBS9H8]
MVDRLQRPVRDLRISVTDRCNFRCRYCMPQEVFGPGFAFLPRAELLSFEEITRIARAFARHGVTKLRLTGGEPLLRRDLPDLIRMLVAIEGIVDVALTTNGSLLAARAAELAAAGLHRVSVSLDALDDPTFAAMNGVSVKVARVLAGIDAAAAAGLAPVKVNMVVQRGVNEHALLPMAACFRERGHTLRFIEYMDVGSTNAWQLEEVVPAAEIRDRIHARWPLEPVDAAYPGEVAARYRYRDGAGEIGLITSVTQPFCGSCSRARLSADGRLYTCLFTAVGHDLRGPLRAGVDDDELDAQISRIWRARTDRYSEQRASGQGHHAKVEMSYIGG